jgi:DNA (cytosine-5)-methyltransferase 1
MTVKWQSEIDPYACRVLKKHWPDVPNLGNIKEINWKEVEKVDVICGGYPCQPFSTAGKRNGEEDPRHLWPWVREAISELRPHYAILENVRGHLSLGGLSVIGELASIGYDAEWRVISAASVGANHKRDRIVIVAYPDNAMAATITGVGMESETIPNLRMWPTHMGKRGSENADQRMGRDNDRLDNGQNSQGRSRSGPKCTHTQARENGWTNGSVLKVQCWAEAIGRMEGSGWQWWETEPDVGRVAHGIPSRVDRLRGLGNAVVPQVAEIVGRLIMEAHNEHL